MNPFDADMQQVMARTRQCAILKEARRDHLIRRARTDRSKVVRTSWLKTALVRFWIRLKTSRPNPDTPGNET